MTRNNRSAVPTGSVWPWLPISLLFIIGLLLPGSTVGAENPPVTPALGEPTQWSTETVSTMKVTPGERPSKGHPRLESSLSQLLDVHRRDGLAEAQTFAMRHHMVLQDDRVQVKIVTTAAAIDKVREAVEAAGGEYQTHYQHLLQALVPLGKLEALAERPDVQIIREPLRPIPLAPMQAGSETAEGAAASNALAWHAAGYDGTGVRVAVIDTGFTGYTGLLGTDLPASVTTYDWTGSGMVGTPHGTACAEIVYDMAYGATIDVHKISTDVELGNAVAQAITDDVEVISMSLGWPLDGPGNGMGNLARIVKTAQSNGIFFAVAAGDEAEVSWSGLYNDDGSGAHEWSPGQTINYFGPGHSTSCYLIPAGDPIIIGLHWDDWSAFDQDYDLELYRLADSSWSLMTGSYNRQNGEAGQTPEEFISISAPYSACYGVAISDYSTTRNGCLSLDCPNMSHLDEWVTQRSLTFPADSLDAVTVGAVKMGTYDLERHSSQGPTFGSGGACSGGATKPDIAAYANVSTVSYGASPFSGTSAATPHVAGAAALVKQASPAYSMIQVQSFLEGRAIDLGDPGKDNLYGTGRLYLGAPPAAANNPPNTPSDPSPTNGALGQDISVDLGWTGGDPDADDTVSYDVYLEADDSTPDALICDDVSTPVCDPGTLAYDTHYYWYVVAADSHGASTTGDTWGFATGKEAVYLPIVLSNWP